MAIVAIFALSAVINLLALYQVAVGRPVSPAVDVGPVLDRIPDIVERAVALVTAIGAIVAVVQGRGDARR